MGFWDPRDIHFGSKLLFESQQRKIHSGQPFSNGEMQGQHITNLWQWRQGSRFAIPLPRFV